MQDIGDAIRDEFGDIDIYLFDQLARGRITRSMRVLDAACGAGRNVIYLLRQGVHVCGVDRDGTAIERLRDRAGRVAPGTPADRFRVESIEALSFPDASFEVVIANAALHFAQDDDAFASQLRELWRVVKPGGMLFTRLASTIGIESLVEPLGGHRFRLPDGSERFLVDEAFLLDWTRALGGELLDPIKTTNVQGKRCMTTWVFRKGTA